MNHVMVDLETLGQTPGCAILSIGAVAFDPYTSELGPEFYEVVNTRSCFDAGLKQDESTVNWWKTQKAEAAAVLDEARESKVLLAEALSRFRSYLQKFGLRDIRVWGNGSDFDNAILACCYKSINQNLPWRFYNNRCFRTLKNIRSVVEPVRQGTYHNALDDAKHQARHALALMETLR